MFNIFKFYSGCDKRGEKQDHGLHTQTQRKEPNTDAARNGKLLKHLFYFISSIVLDQICC